MYLSKYPIIWTEEKNDKGVVTRKRGQSAITEYILTLMKDGNISLAYYDNNSVLQRLKGFFNSWPAAVLVCQWHLDHMVNEIAYLETKQAI